MRWTRRHAASRDELLAELTARAEDPVYGPTMVPWRELIAASGDSPDEAWEVLEATMLARDTLGERLNATIEEVSAVVDEGSVERAIEMIDEAVSECDAHVPLRGAFELLRSSAIARSRDRGRKERQEEGIAALNKALECAPSGLAAAQTLHNLAVLYAEREAGDKRRNLDVAIELFRLGLAEIDDASPALLARLQTNLAMALLRTDRGERRENLREARDLCEEALRVRTLDVDPDGWAHSQVNRATAIGNLESLEGRGNGAASVVYEEVIAEAARISDRLVLSGAYFELARIKRIQASRSPEDRVRIVEDGNEDEEATRERSLLDSARSDLDAATEILAESDDDALALPRVEGELTVVLGMLGDDDEAIAVGRRAMSGLLATQAPRGCVQAGTKLGGLLIERGEWAEAAEVYRKSLEAAALLFQTTPSRELREIETRGDGLLGRWAAIAFAHSGEPEAAVVALESSRTRELRFRLDPTGSDSEALEGLPSELRKEYEAARAEFTATSPLASSGPDEARLQEALSAIRAHSGFTDFGRSTRIEDIGAAVEEGRPLVYVDPTPAGTLLLVVSREGGARSIASHFLADVTSTEIFMRLLGADGEGELGESYLNAAGTFGERPSDLRRAWAGLEPWIAEKIARPIARALGSTEARGATLVVCGPLVTFPVGAVSWTHEGRSTSLLEQVELRHAPSAAAAGQALARARESVGQEPYLLGLGDPAGNLAAAGAEIEEIALHFGEARSLSHGDRATAEALREEVGAATHLHLATHAGASVFAPEIVGIELADGILPPGTLWEIGPLRTRLTVLSACQTAVPDLGHLPGEAHSIATALLLAGSACVVATLWPVDDAATAMLMVRLYEELFQGESPAAALRRAQFWLRDLTVEDERHYLSAHPQLAAEFIRRRRARSEPGARGRGPDAGDTRKPYAHPVYWAGFLAIGA